MIVSFTTPAILKVGLGAVAVAIAALTIKGSILVRGQVVCDSVANPNCGLVYGVQGFDIPAYGKDTSSGGLAKYDTILDRSPYNSTATTRGLKTGTGVVRWAILNIISNPKAAKIDCSKVATTKTGTGGTALFEDKSATGSTSIYSTPFVLGPTEYVKCGTSTIPDVFSGSLRVGSFSGTLLLGTTYSEVIN